MLDKRMMPAKRIEVTDQVGKRHVVVKYTERLDGGARHQDEIAAEYRLETGMSVDKTGADTFQTANGRLRLKAL
ncbi:hypothetical protein J7E70_29875 [Variovorax paradoxus]|nr:hypothetical protein [Variovorax paradoxus]MBT2304634.1 hypothetical protein [Variovorax paradoxus]